MIKTKLHETMHKFIAKNLDTAIIRFEGVQRNDAVGTYRVSFTLGIDLSETELLEKPDIHSWLRTPDHP